MNTQRPVQVKVDNIAQRFRTRKSQTGRPMLPGEGGGEGGYGFITSSMIHHAYIEINTPKCSKQHQGL